MNAASSTFIVAQRPSRNVIRRLRQADTERNRANHRPFGAPTFQTTLPPPALLQHSRRKKKIRRKATDARVGRPFGGPPANLPEIAAIQPPQAVRADSDVQALPVAEEFVEFGPGDEYYYDIPEKQPREPRIPSLDDVALYKHWNELLPKLEQPLLDYALGAYGQHMGSNIGTPIDRGALAEGCAGETCAVGARPQRVTYVHMRRKSTPCTNLNVIDRMADCDIREIKLCSHVSLPVFLVRQGMFPSAPCYPGYAFSIDMLNFFLDLSRNGANSAESIAASLHAQHRRNGFILRNAKGEPILDGFRQHINPVLTWYDILRARIERQLQATITSARSAVLYPAPPAAPPSALPAKPSRRVPFPTVEDVTDEDEQECLPDLMDCDQSDSEDEEADATPRQPAAEPSRAAPWHPDPPARAPAGAGAGAPPAQGNPMSPLLAAFQDGSPARHWIKVALKHGLSPEGRTTIAQYLVGRCSKCFATSDVAVPLKQGGSFHVASDGCFGHRHNATAGDSAHVDYTPESFVAKEFVDAVGCALDEARDRPERARKSKVPEAALKQCEKSHTAANGSRIKAAGDKHDVRGLFALICRHDITLFICNIDTPGEQQKYSLALLLWLMLHLPDEATITNLYDVGCVLHKSLLAYEVMPASMESRVAFATSAMHAYAHQWECQLVYNPRMQDGLGLTDGEGVERLWSRIRKLISILRGTHLQRRKIILDRHIDWLAARLRDEQGKWLTRKWKLLKTRETTARDELRLCGYGAQFLREQWLDQRETQLRVRRMTAPRLKKELEAVMAVQDQVHSVEEAIAVAETALREAERPASLESHQHLDNLRRTLLDLTAQADALYSSLNVEEDFPGIEEFGLDFARALIMAYDAKCIARHKLIGRFFEWDYLDRAVGGVGEALGTKQHQKVVQAIQRRAPAITKAIQRYNACCATVRALLPPGKTFPLPEELPTDLTALKNDPSLLEDVWVTYMPEGMASWLTDPTVRRAIRAQLVMDRCAEERVRLKREQQNLFNWMELEGKAIAHALRDPDNRSLTPLLLRERARLEDLATGCKLLTIPRERWLEAARGGMLDANAAATVLVQSQASISARTALLPPSTSPHRPRMDHAPARIPDGDDASDSDSDDAGAMDGPDDGDVFGPAQVPDVDANPIPAVEFKEFRQVSRSHIDMNLEALVAAFPTTEAPLRPPSRYRAAQDGFKAISAPMMGLHDLAVNRMLGRDVLYAGLAVILKELAPESDRIAVIHPDDYALWAGEPGANNARLYRQLEDTQFWSKQVILVPIWENPHWCLAIVYPGRSKIDFFDSFGFTRPWRRHVPLVSQMLSAQFKLAVVRGKALAWPEPTAWESRPLVSFAAPLQTPADKIDCGMWLLAVATAAALSYRTTSLTRAHMPALRLFVFALICKHIPLVHAS